MSGRYYMFHPIIDEGILAVTAVRTPHLNPHMRVITRARVLMV